MSLKFDLIKTIADDDEVSDLSENSENEEEEFQPTKKIKKKTDFEDAFHFVSDVAEYNADTWNDLSKYIKRKANTKIDKKIETARQRMKEEAKEDPEVVDIGQISDLEKSDGEISDDELQRDFIRDKEKLTGKRNKKKKKVEEIPKENDEDGKEFFEDAPPFDENASFYQMNLSRPLMKAITAMKYIHPTPIQAATIPVVLMGRDVCGCAATGTGKTAAYMLPILERLIYRPMDNKSTTRVLVLVPTRELGVQVYEVTRQLAQFTTVDVGLAVGGLDLKIQESVLRKNPDIVIATPGRLIDHIKNTLSFSLDRIEILVLDEADRMLDEHFAEQMKEIIRSCARTRQTLLFSATMTEEVKDLAAVSLDKPVKVFVDSNRIVAFNLRQEFIRIRSEEGGRREAILAALVCRTFRDRTMIFVQTKVQAHRLRVQLGLLGVKIGELHGNLTQPQRLEALKKFKDEEINVLVATDVAARGLDIQGVKTVINFVMPATLEHYIHRVGRTARAGRAGVSVSLIGNKEWNMLKEIVKKATNPVKMRIIPPEIFKKYTDRLVPIESQVKLILKEEWEEKEINKMENKANHARKLLEEQEAAEKPRIWFQTRSERMLEKKKFILEKPEEKKEKGVKDPTVGVMKQAKLGKGHKKVKDTAEDRARKELDKVQLLKARFAKKQHRVDKIRVVGMGKSNERLPDSRKMKRSSFDNDLTDISAKGAKRMRYDANFKQKMDNRNKNKGNGNKLFNKERNNRSFNGKQRGGQKKFNRRRK